MPLHDLHKYDKIQLINTYVNFPVLSGTAFTAELSAEQPDRQNEPYEEEAYMEYRIIPKETYARIKHFEYFKNMAQPYAGVTVHVDITEFYHRIKSENYPFFLSFLYCVSNAANEIPELRQRINDGNIIEYARCRTSHTVALENGTYCYCMLDSSMDFEDYLPYAVSTQEQAKKRQSLEDGADSLSLIFISSLPWLTYEALIQPVPNPADSNPRITWGRYTEQNGRVTLPVSILCHHALADGLHLSRFYQILETTLEKFPFIH